MNIYIGNLAFTASEDDVRQLFESYGAVDTVHLITDRETGRARGFGFVDMADDRAASRRFRDSMAKTSVAGRSPSTRPSRGSPAARVGPGGKLSVSMRASLSA